MSRIYVYKLTADNGGAPCIEDGLLSLAICKPMIRRMADKGDLIFGFAANSLHRDNRLIYVARITKKLSDGQYYQDSRYRRRRDCIYRFEEGRFVPRKNARYHLRPEDLPHDLGEPPRYTRANVLLSTDFRYFGGSGSDDYKGKFKLVSEAIQGLGRGHRVHYDRRLYDELHRMARWIWTSTEHKVIGSPSSEPSGSVCQRGGSCAIVLNKKDRSAPQI